MAYAAAISLKQTIHRLQNSSHISLDSSTRETLDLAHNHLTSVQQILKKSDDRFRSSKKLNSLDKQIKKTLHQLQDSLEFHVSDKFLSTHADEISSSPLPLELDLNQVWQNLNPFAEAVTKMANEYNQSLDSDDDEDEDSGDPSKSDDDEDEHEVSGDPSKSDDDEDEDEDSGDPSKSQTFEYSDDVKMVGLSDIFNEVKDHLTRVITPDEFGFFSFVGKAGIGRSILARKIYDDIYTRNEGSFDCGAWVRIGSTYQLKEILLNIISQINGIDRHEFRGSDDGDDGEEELGNYLYRCLEHRKYIVGLDEVPDVDVLIRLRKSLPEQSNGSLVILTTDVAELAEFDESFTLVALPTLDERFVWPYIRSRFFDENEAISEEFEEIGMKIARNCRCNLLVMTRVTFVLQKMETKVENWRGLAEAEHDRIYVVEDEILEERDLRGYMVDDDLVWSKYTFEFSTLKDRFKEHLYPDRLFPKMGIMTIHGMAGVGKTTLMKKLFQESSVLRRFDHCAWVNLGSSYKYEEILVDTLAQIYPHIDREDIKEDANLAADLCAQLSYKKCLIVLDDLWNQEPVHFLKKFLPNIKGELVVTTRLLKVGIFGPCDRVKKFRLLNKDESWDLLREKVFSEELCSSELEIVGRKIAEKCEGLPLLIVAVANYLSKYEKTLEYWNNVVENKNGVFIKAQDDISSILLPSYEFLHQHLKACFLYMGVFPRSYGISTSKLINLWFVEGFLEPNPSQTVEDCAARWLKELVDSNVVIDRQKSSYFPTYKSCALHFVFWHLSCKIAMNNKFFQDLTIDIAKSMKSSKSQRILCIRNNSLLGIQEVCDVVGSFSNLHSFVSTGPPHPYPVPLYFAMRLLKVLEALAIRFYEFPIEVVKLLHLRYIALTCNGELPSSISKLWNLQFLIIRQYLSIKSSRNSSSMPKEIWDMKELKHLQISERQLPNPDCGALLPNLVSFLEVTVQSCTKRILKRIPNLKKLGIKVQLPPDIKSNPFHCLNRISRLRKLESLKCVVVNPELGSEVVIPPAPRSMFPSNLKKLSLSGLGFSWEYLSIIGKLQNLEVLKLRCYAFRGPYWKVETGAFPQLKFLLMEDTDLVSWEYTSPTNTIRNLQYLSIRHCYKLKNLPYFIIGRVKMIEVVDSHPLAVTWAKKMKEADLETRMETLEIHVKSSWNRET